MMIGRMLSSELPKKMLSEMIFLGGTITAQQACDAHLVNRVVDADDLQKEALALAKKIAALSPVALRLGKAALLAQAAMPTPQALSYLNDQLALALLTDDGREGIAAFLQKRQPTWTGK